MSMLPSAGFLRLYSPELTAKEEGEQTRLRLWSGSIGLSVTQECEGSDEASPMILKWSGRGACSRPVSAEELLARTRLIHRNRQCRACRSPVVEPMSRDDSELNRNLMPIPGTATLTGFRCQSCRTEWSIE